MALVPPLPGTPLTVFTDLRDLLAEAYRDRPSIEHFLQEYEGVRLKARDIDLTHSAAVSWQNILERAHQEGRLDKLLLEVAKDRPGIASRVVRLADAYVQTLPLSRIRREFARLYPSVNSLEDVLGRFNAEPSPEGRAPLGSREPPAPAGSATGGSADMEARWQAVLEQAHAQGSLPELVRLAAREHPHHADELEQHLLDYRLHLDPDDPQVNLLEDGNPLLSEWSWLELRIGRFPRRLRLMLGSVWTWVLLWEVASVAVIKLSDYVGASCMSFDVVKVEKGYETHLTKILFGYRYELNHALLNVTLAPVFFLLGAYFLKRVGRSLNEWSRRQYLVAIDFSGICTARQVVVRLGRINRRWAWATGLLVATLCLNLIKGEYNTRTDYDALSSSKATFGWVQADLVSHQRDRLLRMFHEGRNLWPLPPECFENPGTNCQIKNVVADAHHHPKLFRGFLGLAWGSSSSSSRTCASSS